MLGLVTELCPRCGRHRHPHEVNGLAGGAKICWECIKNHEEALLALAGEPPRACQMCNTPVEQLQAGLGEQYPMVLTWKDGICQILCLPCRDKYYRLRADFFKGTAYAERKKLFGMK